jgi:hypothetical protein
MVDEGTGSWRHWASCVPEWTYPSAEASPKFAQMVIPTLDSVRCVCRGARAVWCGVAWCAWLPGVQELSSAA